MKKGAKIGIGIAALFAGAMVLSGCTNNFCSLEDKAHILYALDYGVCDYYGSLEEAQSNTEEGGIFGQVTIDHAGLDVSNLYYSASLTKNKTFYSVYTNAGKAGYRTPSLEYYVALDSVVLKYAMLAENVNHIDVTDVRSEDFQSGILIRQGHLKFFDGDAQHEANKKQKLWTNWNYYNNEVRTGNYGVDVDECPQNDFIKYYQTQMNTKINSSRSCLATKDGFYGNYGDGIKAKISGKSWGYPWSKGWVFSSLLVYPIGWSIETIATGILNKGGDAWSGWAQLIAILVVTVVVRSLMLAATFKQTTASSKMQELQPEIAKIQAKYPNANSNQYEKQRVAQETQALYKKHKINPLTSILVMIVQFPVFICVWGAMQGSAVLSSGSVLGLDLSRSISSVLTTWSNWTNPAANGVFTALGLFLLMSGAQVVSMLLPQWLTKAEKKKIAKLGRNPSQKENENKTKWFTYIMLGMIIFMGFSLVSALGVYWLVGALFSVAQTLITHAVMRRKKMKKMN